MDNPPDWIYIEHILAAIGKIEAFLEDRTLEDFVSDAMLNSAVTRQIEIIGEASKRLSEKLKDELGFIPWRRIGGMRDFLIHDYIDVELEIVWKAATIEIMELKTALENYKQGKVDYESTIS